MAFWKRSFTRHSNLVQLEHLVQQISEIRKYSDILAIAPGTTGYSWMGVNRATFALFPTCTVELPQYYSNSLFQPNELKQLVEHINAQHFSKVIFSGFPEYFAALIEHCRSTNFVIYHGFYSELSGNLAQQKQFFSLIELAKSHKIQCIAFNKKGMAESVHELWKVNTCKITLPTPSLPEVQKHPNGTHIGVLGNNQFRKNLINQVVAAGLINQAEVHATSEDLKGVLPNHIPLHIHPSGIPHSDFIQILGSMDINLHISYSESWGQLTTESLAMGVPCLVANHSDIFDFDDRLKELFVVEDYDNAWAIRERIQSILEMGDLSETCRKYIETLNTHSAQSMHQFLAR
jgi:glycosyltransferase involved in cell wall biosynthesis